MIIDRVQVEGGFLNSVDVRLLPGLNVIIGARGTGKTSLIELIRYALDVKNLTSEARIKSADHASSVIEGGEVCVTLSDQVQEVVVTRSAEEERPRSTFPYVHPIILSQTEIETVGLSETGRLNLIDGFLPNRSEIRKQIAECNNNLKSLFKEVEAVERELTGLGDGIEKFEAYSAKIKQLEEEQKKYQGGDGVAQKQFILGVITSNLSDLAVKNEVLERFGKSVSVWAAQLEEHLFEDYGMEEWNASNGEDPLEMLRPIYSSAINSLEEALNSFNAMKHLTLERLESLQQARGDLEKDARTLRMELEHNAAGAGSIARQISAFKSNAAQIQARQKVINDRQQRLDTLRQRRDEKIQELIALRSQRSYERRKVIRSINLALEPWIKVEIQESSQVSDYARAIANALRSSGMKYSELASTISERVSPQELLEFVDFCDFEMLSDITGIPKDRSARLLNHLAEAGISEIITSEIEDGVRFTLLDGVERKEISSLSAGQRCTVILSIVLQHDERTLIIDQPEDHLDNSYIANTVIQALLKRKKSSQVIISTHNANIPVLGKADRVIQMMSNGRYGFVQLCEELENPRAVDAIKNVMEGGAAAFADRAEFYGAFR
ncbi:hypothetical protein [Pseudomonas germanica]